jgi:hypothetical protein
MRELFSVLIGDYYSGVYGAQPEFLDGSRYVIVRG